MTDYERRYQLLDEHFRLGNDGQLNNSTIEVHFYRFESRKEHTRGAVSRPGISPNCIIRKAGLADQRIKENESFEYPVFVPAEAQKMDQAILLLHGLNERSWSKYLPWAATLCELTGKPVILFPIAFHINRAPCTWSNPRSLASLVNIRREKYSGDRSISFANIALSDRISQRPERFYLSGRQTWGDLTALFSEIKSGKHPAFKEGTTIDIFAYSIGAFLSQVAIMANQKNLFSDTKLFMFCGGSIFRSMQGISRSILDKPAFEQLQHYYVHVFGNEHSMHDANMIKGNKGSASFWKRDKAFHSFLQMILPQRFKKEREAFFSGMGQRIQGVALANDTVIPYHGIEEALGKSKTREAIELLDYPFPYSHENPFPLYTKEPNLVNIAFNDLMARVADFLG